jgi:hypothetical protein
MVKSRLWSRLIAVVLWSGFVVLPGLVLGQTNAWLEPWGARHEVTVPNPCVEELYDYQVQITLDASFDFAGALPDGSDVVITDDGGLDCIPYWVEEWDPGSSYASIWVKVPVIPIAGTTVYLYYGNPSPPGPPLGELMEVGPIGPWDKQTTNIIPTGAGSPSGGNNLLAENMVYDDVTGHYWLVFANYNNGSVGLAWSDDPDDPASWTWHGTVVSSANAPHILYYDGLWYIFYADQTYGMPGRPISVSTSASIGGPYTKVTPPVLTPSETWETARVDEPYVFQRNDGKWILMYMGDAGGTTEQVGYAEADDILGPYTKFAGNPCIPFGPPGSIDAGTVADAWVVELDDVYYIGYTVSSSKSSPWRTALATTTDWMTFTKHGVILDWGGSGDWDERDAFRGAVTRIGDTYYFPYTGHRTSGGYLMGMATMDAFQMVYPPVCNDPEAVFEFIDMFEGDALDMGKWVPATTTGYAVSGGVCTLTGTPSSYLQMRATTAIGIGTLMETHASHLDAGLNPGGAQGNTAAEIGYKRADMSFGTEVIRIMDWPDLTYYCVQLAGGGVSSVDGQLITSVPFDIAWHTYRVNRTTVGTVEFQIDDNPYETFGPTYVPTSNLYPWLMSYSRNTAPQSRFEVDWVRVRKYCGTETATSVGAVQYPTSNIFGYVYGEGTGLYGIAVMVLDGNGDPYGSDVTDNTGYYEFVDVPWGDYTVTVSTPLGYVAAQETFAITLTGSDEQVDFNLSRMMIPMAQRGRGYWMHQANALLTGKGNAQESFDDMCEYLELIRTHFNQHQLNPISIFAVDLNADCTTRLEALRDVISPRPKSSMEDKAKSHLTALLLNMVSGKIAQWAQISEDGATVSQAITYCDMLISDGDPANDEMAKNIAEMINEGQVVPGGWIDPATHEYTYKGNGALPTSFSLGQNYPNPFNPSTTLDYALPSAAHVTIDVYNVVGQHVLTLVDEVQPAGFHMVTWSGTDESGSTVATGVYLYRFRAGDYTETRKMLLMK